MSAAVSLLTERVRYHARWVVPVAAPPIADGTVITERDRIVWVGPRAHAPKGGRDEALGERSILTPGLVNAHTHLELTMMRGFLEDLPFFDWVRTLTRVRAEVVRPEDARDAALLGVAEGLRSGITTFGDTGDSSAPFDALRSLGARGIAYREVFGPDPAEAAAALARLQASVAEMRKDATPLVRVGVSPHAPYSVSNALFSAVATWAAKEALPVAVHLAESAEEDALVQRGEGPFADFLRSRGIAVARRAPGSVPLLRAVGLVRPDTLVIHVVRAGAEDIRAIANAGCGVAHCPVSNAKLGHGAAHLGAFVAAGARVGLGSDSMASNNEMDILAEARVALLQQRVRAAAEGSAPLSARAIFRLATLGGAEALRLDAEVGSLEVGKQADLAVFSVDLAGAPAPDPVAALVFAPARARVTRVIVAGVERVQEGRVQGFDPAVAGRVDACAARLAEWRRAQLAR